MPTLNWLIQDSNLNNLRLITGENHILQEIRSVNVLDNPDVLKWFKQDELILTTGYCFKDRSSLQRQMIKDMHDIGCTALAIKTKRFFRQIPELFSTKPSVSTFPLLNCHIFIPSRKSLRLYSNRFIKSKICKPNMNECF